MKLFVYSLRDYDEKPYFDNYCAFHHIEYGYTKETPSLENIDLARGYDVIDIITTKITPKMIDGFYNIGIKCIATRTIGYDHIDYVYARKKGMGVVHISYSPSSVADYAIMLILMGLRKTKYILQCANLQNYTLKGKIGKELPNCTVGVIGTGKIGSTFIKHLSGFGCKIYAYDVFKNEDLDSYVTYTSLEEIYKNCDIISLHAPATKETYHMINESAIHQMKTGVILINCARGSLVDTQALIEGIQNRKIGFAGLDVIEQEEGLYYFNHQGEPLNNTDLALLRSFPNVVLTPHTAFYTEEAVSDMVENSIIESLKYFNTTNTTN